MPKNLLLPHRCKHLASFLLIVALAFILIMVLRPVEEERTDTWLLSAATIAMIALPIIALSRERIEDEYISSLRGQTLVAVIYLFFIVNLLRIPFFYVGTRILTLGEIVRIKTWTDWLSNPVFICAVYVIISICACGGSDAAHRKRMKMPNEPCICKTNKNCIMKKTIYCPSVSRKSDGYCCFPPSCSAVTCFSCRTN